ncbi:SCO family protein [Crocinitomicaceae bacterium]|nr:SCO family protein [Crocinitomicaceae bacterium]MDC0257808.1 SCO family protein [Crocinitomicaceae bacterium]
MKHTKYLFLLTALISVFAACKGGTEEREDPMAAKKAVMPIIGNYDIQYTTKNGKEMADTIYHMMPTFTYLNQDSVMMTSKDFEGKIKVVDFFFTHCPSICPPMTAQMRRLNIKTKDIVKHLEFLSFSIDPEKDTPTRLREYIKEKEIFATNWNFFTGDEDATHELAKKFFNGAERNREIAGGFGHTPYFVLVDKEGYPRGIYDGTDPEKVDQLEKDIRKLLKLEYKVK